MDEQPPRPLIERTHATRTAQVHSSSPASSSPAGSAIGMLAAGIFALLFVRWFALSGPWLFGAEALGFILVIMGLILAGVSIGALVDRPTNPRQW